jgi:hypothetical protein
LFPFPKAFMRMLVLAIAGVLLPAEPAATQSVRTPKFSIVFSGGVRPAGPWGQDIAAGMRRANLDGDPCGDNGEVFCSFSTQPDVEEHVLSYSIELGFRATPVLELALAYGSVSAGTVSGYFDGGNTGTGDSDAELLVAMHAKTVTVSGRYLIGQLVRIGGGPSLRIQETSVTTGSDLGRGGRTDRSTTVRPGFAIEAGVVWPRRSRLFVDLGVRYSWAAAASFGPYDAVNEQEQLRTTMPSTRASFAHFVAGIGAGLRF